MLHLVLHSRYVIPRHVKCICSRLYMGILVHRFEYILRVLAVHHHKVLGIIDGMDILPQKLHTEAVKCADVSRITVPDHLSDTFAHLPRRFICKCDTQYIRCGYSKLVHQIRIPVCERLCLAGSRSRNYAHIPFCGGHCLLLLFIQFIYKIIHTVLHIFTNICSV